jgi:hypothetical protein
MTRVVLLFFLLANAGAAIAQTPSRDWPFPSRSPATSSTFATPSPTPSSTPPPYDVPLRQESWEQLPNREISRDGQTALALRPQQWHHGETENFIFHYRGLSDALQIAREIEFDLWYVAQSLGAARADYTKKSHVYVFADEKEWQKFLAATHAAPWSHSFAQGDELFLNVRAGGGGFDSQTLAHETTHAVVARLYHRRWPVWLNEGFAEYMADASMAARHSRPPQSTQHKLTDAKMTVAELMATRHYPLELDAVWQLYETSSKFVRYLFNKYPHELFPKFVDRLLTGEPAAQALAETYGDEFRDMAEFEKRFSRFTR